MLFCTYSTLVSTGTRSQRKTRFKQIVDWCGPGFDGCLVFDECHKAKNYNIDNEAASSKVLGSAVVKCSCKKLLFIVRNSVLQCCCERHNVAKRGLTVRPCVAGGGAGEGPPRADASCSGSLLLGHRHYGHQQHGLHVSVSLRRRLLETDDLS